MPHSYLGRDDLKAIIGTTTTREDAGLRRALEGVSEQIDRWMDRTFQPYTATRVYTAGDAFTLDVDDLLSVTSLKFDQDGDRVYEVTLATSDWELGPPNATVRREPYSYIDMQPNGSYRFDRTSRGVQVVGTWGYWQDLVASAASWSTAALPDATSTSLTLVGSAALQPQQTILAGSEQIYVNEITTSSAALVERGVNGTTPAAHTTADAIQVYRYPAPIVEACRIQANRLWKRRDAPLGSFAGPTDMTENVVNVVRLDPDVEKLLETYRRYRYLGV